MFAILGKYFATKNHNIFFYILKTENSMVKHQPYKKRLLLCNDTKKCHNVATNIQNNATVIIMHKTKIAYIALMQLWSDNKRDIWRAIRSDNVTIRYLIYLVSKHWKSAIYTELKPSFTEACWWTLSEQDYRSKLLVSFDLRNRFDPRRLIYFLPFSQDNWLINYINKNKIDKRINITYSWNIWALFLVCRKQCIV